MRGGLFFGAPCLCDDCVFSCVISGSNCYAVARFIHRLNSTACINGVNDCDDISRCATEITLVLCDHVLTCVAGEMHSRNEMHLE